MDEHLEKLAAVAPYGVRTNEYGWEVFDRVTLRVDLFTETESVAVARSQELNGWLVDGRGITYGAQLAGVVRYLVEQEMTR
jgi:hypothetical protein